MKKIISLILAAVLLLSMTGCGGEGKPAPSQPELITITDQDGFEVKLPKEINRIVVCDILPLPSVLAVFFDSAEKIVGMSGTSMNAAKNSLLGQLYPEILEAETGFIDGSSVNAEELMKLQPDVVFYNASRKELGDQLRKAGFAAVAISVNKWDYDCIETLKQWIGLLDQMFPDNSKTELVEAYSQKMYDLVRSRVAQVPEQERVFFLYKYSETSIETSGGSFFGQWWADAIGARNTAEECTADNAVAVNMEQIYAWNPSLIFITNFTAAGPEDLQQGTVGNFDWSAIDAVANGRVFKMPLGMYRSYTPGVDTPVTLLWLAKTAYPRQFTDIDIIQETKAYYQEVFSIDLTDGQAASIFAPAADAGTGDSRRGSMSMNATPSGDRIHIGFFGRRNAGKSSVVNAVTGQDLAVVSDVKGTTTDPVSKAMELLPLGPVMIIDTPGFDDEGDLGTLRVRKTRQVLNRTDIAILVVDAAEGLRDCDRQLIDLFKAKEISYIVVYNKSDLLETVPEDTGHEIYISALRGEKIQELKERMARLQHTGTENRIIADKLQPGDFAVLVVPIDKAAPKGRLILPQQQTIRDILDAGAVSIVAMETELADTLASLGRKPAMVITDSQVFHSVSRIVPREIPLTSFSILMARYKGLLEDAVRGVAAVEQLKDGDTVLIAEGCTHHRQCDDIGTVKIPNWLRKYTGRDIQIKTCSGMEFPEDLSPYAMVIHCGGCMLNEREVRYRTKCAVDQGVPITNYGILIAHMNGILARSVEIFPDLADALKQ